MKKFVVLYYANADAQEEMKKSTPEDSKKGMEKWYAWSEKCGSALVDLGAPLGNAHQVSSAGSSEQKSEVAGYSVLQAEDLAAAMKLLEDHPHITWSDGCSIEVHECLPLPS